MGTIAARRPANSETPFSPTVFASPTQQRCQYYRKTRLSCGWVSGRHMTALTRAHWACYKPLRQLLRVHRCPRPGSSSEGALAALRVHSRAFPEQVRSAVPIRFIMEAGPPRRLVHHAQRHSLFRCSLKKTSVRLVSTFQRKTCNIPSLAPHFSLGKRKHTMPSSTSRHCLQLRLMTSQVSLTGP